VLFEQRAQRYVPARKEVGEGRLRMHRAGSEVSGRLPHSTPDSRELSESGRLRFSFVYSKED
jgi:hypothetical protein